MTSTEAITLTKRLLLIAPDLGLTDEEVEALEYLIARKRRPTMPQDELRKILDEGFCQYYGYFLPRESYKEPGESFRGTYQELLDELVSAIRQYYLDKLPKEKDMRAINLTAMMSKEEARITIAYNQAIQDMRSSINEGEEK